MRQDWVLCMFSRLRICIHIIVECQCVRPSVTASSVGGKPVLRISTTCLEMYMCMLLNFLADFTQEAASHGLGVVYDLSDSSQKEELVRLLVGTLMEGRRYDVCALLYC